MGSSKNNGQEVNMGKTKNKVVEAQRNLTSSLQVRDDKLEKVDIFVDWSTEWPLNEQTHFGG